MEIKIKSTKNKWLPSLNTTQKEMSGIDELLATRSKLDFATKKSVAEHK
jgi:hypothetical protein